MTQQAVCQILKIPMSRIRISRTSIYTMLKLGHRNASLITTPRAVTSWLEILAKTLIMKTYSQQLENLE
jgi:hypothetical protein